MNSRFIRSTVEESKAEGKSTPGLGRKQRFSTSLNPSRERLHCRRFVDSRNGYLTNYLSLGVNTPCNGLYGKAPPERGTFFRLQVYERVGILLAEVYIKGRKIRQFGL